MSKRRKKKSEDKSQEFYENPEVLAEKIGRTEEFIQKNRTLSLVLAGAIAAAVAAFFVYRYYMDNQNELAQSDMFQAVFYFEQDSLDKALDGDGNNYGFLDIMEEYPSTEAANLANYYAGLIHLKKGNYRAATLYLEDFTSSDLLVSARALSLVGDAYMELEDFQNAAEFYDRAATKNENEYFSPIYLAKAAVAYEKLEETDEAISRYERIVDEFKSSTEYQSAQKHLARLKELTS